MSVDFHRMREVFLAAVEGHPPAEWSAYLDEACAGHAQLRQEVAQLLKAHAEGETPANGRAATYPSAREGPSTVVGPYKLLEPIGEGGMGTVWMAQQQEPVRRKVAL